MGTCQATTKSGKPCSNSARPDGFCHIDSHRPSVTATFPEDDKLTEKQRRFVEAYMGRAEGNATEAARLAGYSGSDETIRAVAYENLTKPHIRNAIEARVVSDPLVADRAELQRFLTRVLRGEEAETQVDREGVEYELPPKMRDRLKAAEMLGKTRGDFKDNLDVTTDGQPLGALSPEDAANIIAEYRKWKDGLDG